VDIQLNILKKRLVTKKVYLKVTQKTKAIYEAAGITCHETPCYEIGKLSGALACMTLPIKRTK